MKVFEDLKKTAQAKLAEPRPSKEEKQVLENWFADRSEWLIVQRNVLFVIVLVSLVAISVLTFNIGFLKSTTSIEPFVIEIDPKSGVPTVVDPLDAKAFMANDAIKRYFILRYIKTREEFYYTLFDKMYEEVNLMSGDVVGGEYRRLFNKSNPEGPYLKLGANSYRTVDLKSMIFQDSNTVQVRIRTNTMAQFGGGTEDKIIYLQFQVANLELNERQRYINPLGFIVTLYRIENEKL